MTPKQMLEAAITGTQGRTPQPITDEFALAIARRLESRGIVKVPGLPEEEESPEDRVKRVLGYLREVDAVEGGQAAERQPEAAPPPQTTAGIVREAISASTGSSGHIPLNGMAVLKAVLAGLGTKGTINGQSE
jgi:hypothetical protein